MSAIERLHAPGYQLITPASAVLSRERYLAAIEAEPFYASWGHGPMSIPPANDAPPPSEA